MKDTKPVVLIVDDERCVISSLKRTLINLHADFIEAESGIQGLKVLDKTNVDLLISDLRMPGMNGIDFATIVRRRYPQMLIIFLSANASIEDSLAAINTVGVHKFLTKPWNESELIDTVRQTLKLAHPNVGIEGCTPEERQWILSHLDDRG